MNITIIGWYGTETIGDRGILAGIFSFLNESFQNFEIRLGSLYPFFTERTINEDYSFYKSFLKKDIAITLFDSKSVKELDAAITNCDLLIMGGGPLMHINPMFMIEYAFVKAQKIKKKTILFGCGVGPVVYKRYKKTLLNIIKHSDITILRDSASQTNLNNIAAEFGTVINEEKKITGLDPSVRCLLDFEKLNLPPVDEKYIAINLRKFPSEYLDKKKAGLINAELINFVKNVASIFSDTAIKLIPMHYFHIGNDDREFLNEIRFLTNCSNVSVQNIPLTLTDTIKQYKSALFNAGMRFHSVVFQSITNGKNLILDYTEPKLGKISGFLKDIDTCNFYQNRYVNLQNDINLNPHLFDTTNLSAKFEPDFNLIHEKLNIYPTLLKQLT